MQAERPSEVSSPSIPGQCSCGKVRFEVQEPALWVSHCHCNNCRRAHGAGVVTWAGYANASFRLLEGSAQPAQYQTETDATRQFCGHCGTPLFFSSPRWPGEIHVALPHLERAPALEPQAHVYADRAPVWSPIHDSLPQRGGADGVSELGSLGS